jgi:hypothetical protein
MRVWTRVTVGLCVGGLATSAAVVADAAPKHWTVTATINPSAQANYLTAIASFTRDDLWAVGAWYRPDLSTPGTLTEHWNGSRWKLVPSPNVTDGYNELYGVDGIEPDDVWAVGFHNIAAYGSERTMALHWNGRRWSVVTTPNLGSAANVLHGVHAISSDDVWAVGFGDDPGGFTGHAIALQWSGSKWRLADLAPRGSSGSDLAAVNGTSADDVWAVGSSDGATLIEHFDGRSWSIVSSPNGDGATSTLSAVAAIAADDVWAVGSTESDASTPGGSGEDTLIMHWDGASWSVVPSPNGLSSSNSLLDVAAFGPDDVWAGGQSYDDLAVTSRTILERWDGSAWRVVRTPNPDADYDAIDGVAGPNPRHLWLVGARGSQTLAMHR